MALTWYNIAIPDRSLESALSYYLFFARHMAIGNCKPKDAEFIEFPKYYDEMMRYFKERKNA